MLDTEKNGAIEKLCGTFTIRWIATVMDAERR